MQNTNLAGHLRSRICRTTGHKAKKQENPAKAQLATKQTTSVGVSIVHLLLFTYRQL